MTMDRAIQSFVTETMDTLEELEGQLLELEGNPSRESIDAVFRAMHTIKGSGAMFGFTELARFTHHLETAFEQVRRGTLPVSAELVSFALAARDLIAALIEAGGGTDPAKALVESDEARNILAGLQALTGVQTDPETGSTGALQEAAETKPAQARFRITYRPAASDIANGTRPDLLVRELLDLTGGAGEVVHLTDRIPPLDTLDFAEARLGYEVTIAGEINRDDVDNVFIFTDGDVINVIEIDPVKAAPTPEPQAAGAPRMATAQPQAPRRADLRVAGERIDRIMDAIGELVISQARLDQVAGKHNDPELEGVIEEMERLVLALRDTTLSIRMLPIETVFGKFQRVVRDLSAALGKDVVLRTRGGETEIDKNVIDRLSEPLVHMIRNAMDHGIENRETREAAGKRPQGVLFLQARQEGDGVVVEVSDDGRGLDTEAIRAKAEREGIIAPGTQLSDQETFRLIFAPGFSTAANVSDVSGRGVGMDAVQTAIEELRGSVNVFSKPGVGTKFSLRLPLSLAIVEGLRVRLGEQVFVIPLSLVDECVELPEEAMAHGSDRRILEIGEDLVPFIPLERVLGLPPASAASDEPRHVVLTHSDGARTGFLVDDVLGQAQTVIKPLSRYHRGIPGLSGATILGDGSVALILDIAALAQTARPDMVRPAA